ncbi:hypothetical protein INR49_027284 [Caranx melampygus]|nr:hypothetical protein INR49_027284 [Caranx melampygus]
MFERADARHPAVVPRLQAGLLARQAGVADEVGGEDVCAGLHQGDVVVQFAVSRITEVLMSVDPLHWENPLCRLGALQPVEDFVLRLSSRLYIRNSPT